MLNRKILGRDSDWPGLSHRPTPVMVVESWQRMGILKLDVPIRTPDLSERCTTSPKEAGCCQKRKRGVLGGQNSNIYSISGFHYLFEPARKGILSLGNTTCI